MSGLLHVGLGLFDGIHNVWVGGAAAQIAAHKFADLSIIFCMALMHARDRGHNLPGRTVAALECIVIDEGLLHRMQRTVGLCQTLDGGHVVALVHRGEAEARQDPPIVDKYGARAALPVIATFFGSGQTGVVAQGIQQRRAAIQGKPMIPAVNPQFYIQKGVGIRRFCLRHGLSASAI
jgi:hypothetical protein